MPKCGIETCTKYNHGGIGYFNHLRVKDWVMIQTRWPNPFSHGAKNTYYCSPECADMRWFEMSATFTQLLNASNDAKYLQRLNKQEFWELLFPTSEQTYVDNKWELWQEGKMEFLWSCSVDKIKILAQYIEDCKRNWYAYQKGTNDDETDARRPWNAQRA